MSAQEIITELEKMNDEERRQVSESLQRLARPSSDQPKRKLSEILQEFSGTVDCWPEDMSVNHDHYLYGTPKRQP